MISHLLACPPQPGPSKLQGCLGLHSTKRETVHVTSDHEGWVLQYLTQLCVGMKPPIMRCHEALNHAFLNYVLS